MQTGGLDQWGNLTAGVDLIHKVEGAAVHVVTTPLLTDSAGQKFGKSEGNAIWLSAEMTSPYAFYQYWLNVEDASVVTLLKVFSDRSPAQIAELADEVARRPFARAAQRALAEEVTTLVHGAAATQAAIAASTALFGRGELAELDEPTLLAALTEAGLTDLAAPAPDVAHLLQASGLCGSLSEARRTVAEGGANLNNRRVSDPEQIPGPEDLLFDRYLVLRRGKRSVAGIRVVG